MSQFIVILEKEAVIYANKYYSYIPINETTFIFDLKTLLEFIATFSTEMTRYGLDYQNTNINDNIIDLTGIFEPHTEYVMGWSQLSTIF